MSCADAVDAMALIRREFEAALANAEFRELHENMFVRGSVDSMPVLARARRRYRDAVESCIKRKANDE